MEKNNKVRVIFYVLSILTIIFAFNFLRPYLTLIILSVLTVILFNPIYRKLYNLFKKRQSVAVFLTLVMIFLTIIIPVIFIVYLSVRQIDAVSGDVSEVLSTRQEENLDEYITTFTGFINERVDSVPILEKEFTEQEVRQSIQDFGETILNFVVDILSSIGSNAASFFTSLILYVMLLTYLFPNQDKIIRKLNRLSPFDEKTNELYMSKMSAMATSMIRGTFVIGVVQGILGAIFLSIAGVPYTFFFAILLSFLSIIPLGGGVVSIPVGLALLAVGNIWEGIFILSTHFLVITNIDNVLRGYLVSSEARLPAIFTLIGIFAGISMFGFLGFIYGPVIMIFIVTTIEIYNNEYNIKDAPDKII